MAEDLSFDSADYDSGGSSLRYCTQIPTVRYHIMPKKDRFAHKARAYEQETRRKENVNRIAELILQEINYTLQMHLMDFGSGTGLLLEKIATQVRKITAVDMSASMNAMLAEKQALLPCEVEILEMDLSRETPPGSFDGIISSMTIHHVKDTLALFKKFYALLPEGGTIALADLDTEDGSFHTTDTGVFHHGFERDSFLSTAKTAGFKELKIQSVGNVIKPYGEYGVFLLTGKR
jgi:cyclopropane fatty-acyl-phospholipid synthase-like methyltransferase